MDFCILNRKRGQVLLFKQHQYYKQKVYKNLSHIWFCRNRRNSIKCSGSVTINGENIVKTVEHKNTCQPHENENEIAISIHKIHEVASTSAGPMTQIYEKHIRPLKEKGLKVPQFESVKCSLYNARKRKLNASKTVFKHIEEVTRDI